MNGRLWRWPTDVRDGIKQRRNFMTFLEKVGLDMAKFWSVTAAASASRIHHGSVAINHDQRGPADEPHFGNGICYHPGASKHFTRLFEKQFRMCGAQRSWPSGRWSMFTGPSTCYRLQLRRVKQQEGELEMVLEGDVVEYSIAVGEAAEGGPIRKGVGVVVNLSNDTEATCCHIEPLCQVDPGLKEWIYDELQSEVIVPIVQVRVLQAWYSQRMVPDRISNPHGEHAESLWILE